MLLNEPTPRHTRPATAATASTRELPPVDLDGAPTPPRRSLAEADTVAFTAVDAGAVSKSAGAGAGASASNGAASSADDDGASSDGADVDSGDGGEASASAGADSDDTAELSAESVPRSNTEAPTVGIEQVVLPPDGTETVALDVEAVKRAVAEGLAASDATATVSLDVAAVKRAMAEASASADDIAADTEPDDIEPADAAPSAPEAAADLPDSTSDSSPDSTGPQAADTQFSSPEDPTGTSAATSTSTDLVPAAESSADSSADSSVDTPTAPYLVSTDLSASASTLVAVPETADDVIATIHAAATAVAAADRRARQAAVAKEDPWTGLDLHQPPTPAPVDNVLDLLAPVLERPLLVVEQPGLPAAADVVALHRSELEVDFVEPPVVAAGAEPPIPPRYGPGLSVLPHIEFPV